MHILLHALSLIYVTLCVNALNITISAPGCDIRGK